MFFVSSCDCIFHLLAYVDINNNRQALYNCLFFCSKRHPRSSANDICWSVLTSVMQPCSTGVPNAHSQIHPRATASCVYPCGLDHSLATHRRLAITFKNSNVCFKKCEPFRGPQNVSSWANFGPLSMGCTPLGFDNCYILAVFHKMLLQLCFFPI